MLHLDMKSGLSQTLGMYILMIITTCMPPHRGAPTLSSAIPMEKASSSSSHLSPSEAGVFPRSYNCHFAVFATPEKCSLLRQIVSHGRFAGAIDCLSFFSSEWRFLFSFSTLSFHTYGSRSRALSPYKLWFESLFSACNPKFFSARHHLLTDY